MHPHLERLSQVLDVIRKLNQAGRVHVMKANAPAIVPGALEYVLTTAKNEQRVGEWEDGRRVRWIKDGE